MFELLMPSHHLYIKENRNFHFGFPFCGSLYLSLEINPLKFFYQHEFSATRMAIN